MDKAALAPSSEQERTLKRQADTCFVSRMFAVLTLAFVVLAALRGRRIQTRYANLVDLIPYFEIGVLLFFLGGLVWVVLKIFKAHDCEAHIRLAVSSLLLTAVGIVIFLGLDWALILFPVERIHLIKYCMLAFFLFYSQRADGAARRVLIAGTCTALVGATEETSQIWLPNRFFDWRDILLNVSGAALGTYLAVVLHRCLRKVPTGLSCTDTAS